MQLRRPRRDESAKYAGDNRRNRCFEKTFSGVVVTFLGQKKDVVMHEKLRKNLLGDSLKESPLRISAKMRSTATAAHSVSLSTL